MKGSVFKNKKTGNWEFTFYAGKDPFSGKRKQIHRRGFNSKKEATENMIKLQAEMLNSEYINPQRMTYDKFMEEWFKERKIKLQESTYDIHLMFYKNVIKPKLGNFQIQSIQPINIQHFITHLSNEGKYSAHTIHLLYRIISASLKKAKTLNLISDNPATGITLPKITRNEIRVWTLEQVNHFTLESKKIKRLTRCYIGFLLAIFTGMRQGEVLGLRWRDVDFDNQTIYIRQTLTQKATIKAGAKNQSSIRSIHIPNKLMLELQKHRNRILEEKLQLGKKYNDYDLVVCTQNGKPIIPRNFRKEFYNLTSQLQLPKIRFHDLRHTHATLLIQQNVNVKLISMRLGHSDIDTTLNVYSHILPNMQESVSKEIDKIIEV